jgi:hypothetical protein
MLRKNYLHICFDLVTWLLQNEGGAKYGFGYWKAHSANQAGTGV